MDLRQNASLKRCRMTPVSKTQRLFGRDELTHQPRLSCQRADTSQHEIAATTMQILPYAFSRIVSEMRSQRRIPDGGPHECIRCLGFAFEHLTEPFAKRTTKGRKTTDILSQQTNRSFVTSKTLLNPLQN
jgi:hypothetical protein